jgi:hypothetical protein
MTEKDTVAIATILRKLTDAGVTQDAPDFCLAAEYVARAVALYCKDNVENFDADLFFLSVRM